MNIYQGDNCFNLESTSLGCNDDGCEFESLIVLEAGIGQTYLIRVGGFNDGSGNGHLETTPQDNCRTSSSIPTIDEWGIIILIALFGISGAIAYRKRLVRVYR